MGLYHFFFPEASEAESLERVARSHERRTQLSERQFVEERIDQIQMLETLRSLENDVGTLALILATILKMLDEKGHITRDDLKEKLQQLDLLDGLRDGQINVNFLRDGSFLSK